MKSGFRQAGLLILCIGISISVALAVPKENGKGKGKDKETESTALESEKHNEEKEKHAAGNPHEDVHAEIIWRQSDRDHIHRYLSMYHDGLPPGLAKRNGDLPPGLEKQLKRNGHLPPGLEKKLIPFPIELERKLPPLKPGTTRGFLGMSAVILNSKTSLILDVFAIK